MRPQDSTESDRVSGAPHPRETLALCGHSEAEARFLEAFRSERLHHAWLIAGLKGIGKATLAWRIARYILVDARLRQEDPKSHTGLPADSLDVPEGHPVTRRLIALSEPGLRLVRRPYDRKSKRIKKFITVGEIRELKSFFDLTSADGLPRVVIVDSADEMNASASNALLKVLEEPPANSYIFLVSHAPSSLLPTIRSRCLSLKCSPLSRDDMVRALDNAGCRVAPAEVDSLAELACGSAGDAVQLYRQNGLDTYAQLISLAADAPGIARHRIIDLASKCEGREEETQYEIAIRLVLRLVSRLASSGASGPPQTDAVPGESGILARLSGSLKAAQSWAAVHEDLSRKASESKSVNIDPFSVMHDMLVQIDHTAAVVAESKP